MQRLRRFRDDHRRAWGWAGSILAVVLFLGASAAFAMGTCHDAGGFCAEEFSATHVEAYATASVLAGLAAASATSAFSLRRTSLTIAVTVGALATALLAVIGESLD